MLWWTSRAARCWRSPCTRAATARSAACARSRRPGGRPPDAAAAEGPVKLGMLQPGEYRELKKCEISALRNAAQHQSRCSAARDAAPAAARRPGPHASPRTRAGLNPIILGCQSRSARGGFVIIVGKPCRKIAEYFGKTQYFLALSTCLLFRRSSIIKPYRGFF